MCLDHGPFLLVHGEEETPLEHVATLIPTATSLKLIDIYGKSRTIDGTIEEIDFLNNRIVLA